MISKPIRMFAERKASSVSQRAHVRAGLCCLSLSCSSARRSWDMHSRATWSGFKDVKV